MKALRPILFVFLAVCGILLGGCSGESGTDAQAQKDMKANLTNRADPSTLSPDQQKRAADMKAMAKSMAAGGQKAATGVPGAK